MTLLYFYSSRTLNAGLFLVTEYFYTVVLLLLLKQMIRVRLPTLLSGLKLSDSPDGSDPAQKLQHVVITLVLRAVKHSGVILIKTWSGSVLRNFVFVLQVTEVCDILLLQFHPFTLVRFDKSDLNLWLYVSCVYTGNSSVISWTLAGSVWVLTKVSVSQTGSDSPVQLQHLWSVYCTAEFFSGSKETCFHR